MPHHQILILADEYMASAMGAVGHETVKTPHLDRLAEEGVMFNRAYSSSPMCVPARGVIQTGRPVHQIPCWDSATPYRGVPQGWGHDLRRQGHTVASVGKLHFQSAANDNGYDPEILPLHVFNGYGWLMGLLRQNPPPFDSSGFAGGVGRGGSNYSEYDARIGAAACQWISEVGAGQDRPWVLLVSFVSPHYPINAPDAFYDLYRIEEIAPPFCYAPEQRPQHPAVRHIIEHSNYDRHFTSKQQVLEARLAYYALCSYVDYLIGTIIDCLKQNRLYDQTAIIFTSDHGEMLGNHGAWTKMLMYEDAVKIPMIVKSPGIGSADKIVQTPVSLLDIAPTMLDGAMADGGKKEENLTAYPGQSLYRLADRAADMERTVFSEYHDGWSISACYMLRWQNWKYNYYVDFDAQLFDLENDPHEEHDRAHDPDYKQIALQGEAKLRAILHPEAVNAAAFRDQQKLIDSFGGESAVLQQHNTYFDYTPLSIETE